ncbi:MAG: pyruvate formate lyase-activating protein [Dehalococcoidia bacterium]|nr:pyruvate formate lyase-activating protein [Dehalococcoidia bacterium]
MRILAVDMGTGTQDILLFDSGEPIENSIKMVMPSATQVAAGRIRRATAAGRGLLLTGVIQGGGPCHWALNDHLAAGGAAYATAEAAKTFDDDLAQVARMGVRVIDEADAEALRHERHSPAQVHGMGVRPIPWDEAQRPHLLEHVELRDLDLGAIRAALAAFDVSGDFDGLALGCLDHGAAPPNYSDRLFRFDHLRRVVEARNDLLAFAYAPDALPSYLTRARSMVDTARRQDARTAIAFLDTGAAAALGALQDAKVAEAGEQLVLNLGNMHALAFHLRGTRIISLYEHHTGELTREQIEDFTLRLMAGTLPHEDVFGSKGHGVFYADRGAATERGDGVAPIVAVTGPQRGKLRGSELQPYFATPHGDMMISGCFGLLRAFGEVHPEARDEIGRALSG